MRLIKTTPVVLADDIQSCARFWKSFGLDCVLEVPGDDGPMFAIFSNGKSEIMYQTRASAELDDSDAVSGVGNSIIYVEVASIEEILQTALQHPIVKPKHITPYGAKEVYIRDPAGNVIGFAELTEGS